MTATINGLELIVDQLSVENLIIQNETGMLRLKNERRKLERVKEKVTRKMNRELEGMMEGP